MAFIPGVRPMKEAISNLCVVAPHALDRAKLWREWEDQKHRHRLMPGETRLVRAAAKRGRAGVK